MLMTFADITNEKSCEDRKMTEGDKARMKRKHRQEITSEYRARMGSGNKGNLLLMQKVGVGETSDLQDYQSLSVPWL